MLCKKVAPTPECFRLATLQKTQKRFCEKKTRPLWAISFSILCIHGLKNEFKKGRFFWPLIFEGRTKKGNNVFYARLCAGLCVEVLLVQGLYGREFSQGESSTSPPASHPFLIPLPCLWDIHAISLFQGRSFSQGEGGHRVDAFRHILIRHPRLQLVVDNEPSCLADSTMQLLVRSLNLSMLILLVLVCVEPPSTQTRLYLIPFGGGRLASSAIRFQVGHGGGRLAFSYRQESLGSVSLTFRDVHFLRCPTLTSKLFQLFRKSMEVVVNALHLSFQIGHDNRMRKTYTKTISDTLSPDIRNASESACLL